MFKNLYGTFVYQVPESWVLGDVGQDDTEQVLVTKSITVVPR